MKTLLLTLLLLVAPFQAYAVSGPAISQAIESAENAPLTHTFLIAVAIEKILEVDPLNYGSAMTNGDILLLSEDIERAAKATDTDWKVLLAITYIESNLCHTNWLKGDKKENAVGGDLRDYWSIGCMQVNLKWWGKAVHDAGLQQEDLLEPIKGIVIGGLILKAKVEQYGWREGIRRYNGIGKRATEYQAKVLAILSIIA